MDSILENRVVRILCLMFGLFVSVSNGAVYKVGDTAGWTTIGNVDYKHWAATKTFQIGDVIGNFNYSLFFYFFFCFHSTINV